MPRYIALLRAINVGGGRTVKMEALRKAFEPLGFSGVRTFISSGNVIFDTPTRSVAQLERMIQEKLRKILGYEVACFVRTRAQLKAVNAYRAFPASSLRGAELNIVFLAAVPGSGARKKLKALQTDTDEFRIHGRELYWLRRRRQGAIPYSTVPLDKTFDEPFTIRSIRTVSKLASMD